MLPAVLLFAASSSCSVVTCRSGVRFSKNPKNRSLFRASVCFFVCKNGSFKKSQENNGSFLKNRSVVRFSKNPRNRSLFEEWLLTVRFRRTPRRRRSRVFFRFLKEETQSRNSQLTINKYFFICLGQVKKVCFQNKQKHKGVVLLLLKHRRTPKEEPLLSLLEEPQKPLFYSIQRHKLTRFYFLLFKKRRPWFLFEESQEPLNKVCLKNCSSCSSSS